MDLGKIISRIRAILATPRTEWPVIAAEPETTRGLFAPYICVVAALPVIAGFIKHSLIGYGGFDVHVHTPIVLGLMSAIANYLLALLLTWVVSLIVDALAPSFGAQKNPVQALKTVAYAWTASWIAGIAILIPWIGWLIWVAGGIYSIYLLYLGVQYAMHCPQDRAAGYTAVSVIIAIVLGWLTLFMVGAIIGTAALTGAHMAGVPARGDHGTAVTVDPDSALGRITALNANTARASKDMENAEKTGDVAAQQAAMGKLMSGDGRTVVLSLPPDTLRTFLPDELDGMKRNDFHAERSGAMGMQISTARADYSDDKDRHVQLELADTGNMRGMMAVASAMAPDWQQQTEHGYTKTYTEHDRLVHESWDTQAGSGEYGVIVANRFSVKASGHASSIDALKNAVNGLDLDKLAALRNEGVAGN